jgi:hypothetical protein
MKKKSPRAIPDFSRQPGHPKDSAAPDALGARKLSPKAAPPPPRGKPQSTSVKSGQRGQ